MSRQIKFRAWWQHDKYSPDGGMYGVAAIDWTKPDDGEPERKLFAEPQSIALVDYPYKVGTYQKLGWNDNCKLMQYTGLHDRNGVEIYEGDIVDDYYFKNSVSRHKVYWADSYGCWSTINLKDPIVDRKQLGYFNEAKDLHRNEYLEVIGNIHENPELLEANT